MSVWKKKVSKLLVLSLFLQLMVPIGFASFEFAAPVYGETGVTDSVYGDTTVPAATYGRGRGLRAEYFDSLDFTDRKIIRLDDQVSFDWGGNSPDPGLNRDAFTVRWSGKAEPRYSELYTFYVEAHGGVRLWVNQQLLVDRWDGNGMTKESGAIPLTAGNSYDLQLEYKEDQGAANAKLLWSSASQPKEAIPKSQLNPPFIPGVPANMRLASTSYTVTIGWDPVEGATGYDLEADGQVIDMGSNTTYTHSNLAANTEHSYRIRAKVPEIEGDWSNLQAIRTKVAVPANFAATVSDESIVLTWDAAAGATGYDIEADGSLIDNGAETAYTHTGLMPNTQHSYRIRARNGGGAGDWSAVLQKTILPEAPTNIRASATSRSITLNWDGVPNATGYDVEADGTVLDNGTNTAFTHSDLTPNTSHAYRVRARTADGPRAWSVFISKSTLPEAGRGIGLKGKYFDEENLSALKETRIDQTVEFDWRNGAPAAGIDPDQFSARWTGQIEPLFSETYTIYVEAHGGVRLWVDNRLLIDDWERRNMIYRQGTIALEAGRRYDIQLEYRETNGTSRIKLLWESATQGKSVIPPSLLYPIGVPGIESTGSSETSVTLRWGAVSYAEGYEVEADGVVVDNGSGTTFVHDGLVPGTLHTYRVRAKNGIVVGEWSSSATAATKLGTTTIQEMAATETAISVSWAPVPGATGYDIETDGVIVDAGESPNYVHGSLLSGTEHSYRVRAKTAAVTGAWSPLARKWTLPDIPTGIRTSATSTSISIQWEAVRGAEGYELDIYNTVEDNGNSLQYTEAGLNSNTQRTYRIRAVNASGAGKWTTIIAKSTLSGVPAGFTATASDTDVALTWDAVAGATGYDLEADGVLIEKLTQPTFVHTGLLPNTAHTYRVRTVNAQGASAWSSAIKVMTLPSVPGQLQADVSADRIVLTWSEVSGATGYDVEADGAVLDNGADTTYVHTGLSPNSEHIYRVRAKNGAVIGQWSAELTKITPSDIPGNLQASVSSTEITVSWDPVIGATGYDLEVDGELKDNGLNTTFVHRGLQPSTEHSYRVRARNRAGAGEWSAAVTKSTGLDKPQPVIEAVTAASITLSWNAVPGATEYDLMVDGELIDVGSVTSYSHIGLAPNSWHAYRVRAKNGPVVGDWSSAITKATSLGIPKIIRLDAASSQITVAWEEVAGAAGYEVEADSSIVDVGPETRYVHQGLKPGTPHTYRVRARIGSEVGEWSGWSALATKSTTPEKPANLAATAATASITLQWGAVAGSLSYDVEVDGQIVSVITGTGYTHQGLKPNTMHIYRVRAVNGNGASEWSDPLKQRTTPELTVNAGQDTIFNFVVVVPKKPDGLRRRMIVAYNPEELEVLDLSAATPEMELAAGPIPGTNMTVIEFAGGRIVYDVINADKTIMNTIKFQAKSNEYSKITYTVE